MRHFAGCDPAVGKERWRVGFAPVHLPQLSRSTLQCSQRLSNSVILLLKQKALTRLTHRSRLDIVSVLTLSFASTVPTHIISISLSYEPHRLDIDFYKNHTPRLRFSRGPPTCLQSCKSYRSCHQSQFMLLTYHSSSGIKLSSTMNSSGRSWSRNHHPPIIPRYSSFART